MARNSQIQPEIRYSSAGVPEILNNQAEMAKLQKHQKEVKKCSNFFKIAAYFIAIGGAM